MTRPLPQSATALLAAAMLLGIAGCGRKTPVRPAVDVLPQAIGDLEARATPAGIQLSWSRPLRYTGGDRMRDLGGFLVQRAASPGGRFETVATIEVSDRDRFQQARRFRHLDGTVMADREYLYQVVSFTLDRYFSAPSNIAVARSLPREANGDATGPAAAAE